MNRMTRQAGGARTRRADPASRSAPSRAGTGRDMGTETTGAQGGIDKASVLVPLFIVAVVLPNYFFLGSLRLSIYKFYLLVGFVPLVGMWLGGRFDGVKKPDLLVLGYCVWSVISVLVVSGPSFWEAAGIHFIETFGAFLLARALIRGPTAYEYFVKAYCIIVLCLIPIALFENLTSRRLLAEIMDLVANVYKDAKTYPRMGLFRAQGPFEHPILFGVFCAGAVSPAYFIWARHKGSGMRTGAAFLMAFGTLTTLSTGAYISAILQAILIFWGWVARNIRQRWRLLTFIFLGFYILIDVLSNRSPIDVFISYLTFNAGSSYNRVLIWHYGTAEVMRHPILGLGFRDWIRAPWMGPSVDNFWLLTAMRYGLPALGFLLGAVVVAGRAVGGRDFDSSERLLALRRGYLFAIVGISLSLCTVTLWNAAYVFFIFMIGSGIWMADYQLSEGEDDADDEGDGKDQGRSSRGRAERPRPAQRERGAPARQKFSRR